jgi:monothiol glutaredoxin
MNGQLVGGGDIIVEMSQMGSLKAAMEDATTKFNDK